MSLSRPPPSCYQRDANIRPTKLHWSRIISRNSSPSFCTNQLLRAPILTVFTSDVGIMCVELLHALVESLTEGTGIHVTLSFYSKIWLLLLLPFQDSSASTDSFSGLPGCLEAEPRDGQAFAKWFYHCSPLNFQPLAHVRYNPAEENSLRDPRALCSAEAGPETARQTAVTWHELGELNPTWRLVAGSFSKAKASQCFVWGRNTQSIYTYVDRWTALLPVVTTISSEVLNWS